MSFLEYSFSESLRNFEITIVTGVCRSGKTLFSRLISSHDRIEYIDEPWTLMTIPILNGMNLIDKEVAQKIMNARIDELMNDVILLRQANFRPGDLSTIWQQQTPSSIFERLIGLQSRRDVDKYIKEHKPILLCVLSETIPFIPFLFETFPKCKIIHVIRHPIDVAQDVDDKKWFSSENLRKPSNNVLYRKTGLGNETYYFPWWVKKGDERYFLNLNDFAKGLYYWRRLLKNNNDKRGYPENAYKEIKYERLTENVEFELQNAANFLKLTGGLRKNPVEIELPEKSASRIKLDETPSKELDEVNAILIELNYPLIKP